MARFLVDEGRPRSVARRASERGLDALHAIDAGLRGARDEDVMDYAKGDGRAVVSADRELGNVFRYPPHRYAGVMLVRIPEFIGPDTRIDRVVSAMHEFADIELAGAVVVVELGRVRVRRFTP